MKFKWVLFAMLLLFSAGLSSCGSSGSEGLNGAITVAASATGSVIEATASYSNPTESNLIGVPLTISVRIGNAIQQLGTFNTNNSGAVSVAFTPPAFNGTQTITVIATSDNLSGFDSLIMAGRSLSVAAPPNLSLSTTAATGTVIPFVIPPTVNFVTITDPFSNNLSGHPIVITATVVSSNTADTLSPPALTTTGSGGVAPFPGASGTLVTPVVGQPETMTITWTVTDTITGQSGSAITQVTLTKTS